MISNEYLERVEAAGLVNSDGKAKDLSSIATGVFDALGVNNELQDATMEQYALFHDSYPEWSNEILVGLPVGMKALGIIARSRHETGYGIDHLPDRGIVALGDLLSDWGKLEVEKLDPSVIHASRTHIDWDESKYNIMKLHARLGYLVLRNNPALPPDVAVAAATHHLHQKTPYSGYFGVMTPKQDLTSRILGLTDPALAVVIRDDSSTPKDGDSGKRRIIVDQTLRSFGAIEPQEVVDEVARVVAESAFTAAGQLNSRRLVLA